MPANLITLPHFSVSSAMSLPNVAAGPGSGTFPRSARRAFSLGSTSPALTALFSTSTISAGVLRGANSIERGGLIARERLGHGPHVRQRVGAGIARYRKRTQLAGLHIFD